MHGHPNLHLSARAFSNQPGMAGKNLIVIVTLEVARQLEGTWGAKILRAIYSASGRAVSGQFGTSRVRTSLAARLPPATVNSDGPCVGNRKGLFPHSHMPTARSAHIRLVHLRR